MTASIGTREPSWCYNVTSSNTVTGGRTYCTVGSGFVDGIRCDVDGRLWATAGDGVEIFAPDGHLIGKILMNRQINNLCFGGPQYKTLFTVGQPNVCSFPVLVAGAVSIRKLAACADGMQPLCFMARAVHGIQIADIGFLGRPGNLDGSYQRAAGYKRFESSCAVHDECREVLPPAFELTAGRPKRAQISQPSLHSECQKAR